MSNKKQTAVDWFFSELQRMQYFIGNDMLQAYKDAKEMEKHQQGYTKEDVIKAGEMGEICYLDTEHIVSYLDEAREANEQ